MNVIWRTGKAVLHAHKNVFVKEDVTLGDAGGVGESIL